MSMHRTGKITTEQVVESLRHIGDIQPTEANGLSVHIGAQIIEELTSQIGEYSGLLGVTLGLAIFDSGCGYQWRLGGCKSVKFCTWDQAFESLKAYIVANTGPETNE